MSVARVVAAPDLLEREIERPFFESFQARELKRAIDLTSTAAGNSRNGMTIAVVSGKGGVGKSNFALNLALSLGDSYGVRTAIIDADLGLANTDVLLGLETRLDLGHVIRGELSVRDIVIPVAEKVWFVPGGSGIAELSAMSDGDWEKILPEILSLDDIVDFIVIDAGAGIGKQVLDCALAADVIVLVTTPEPTALRDAYGMIKNLHHRSGPRGISGKEISLVVNMAFSAKEALLAAGRLQEVSRRFLGLELSFLGHIPHDLRISRSVKAKCPFIRMYPQSGPSQRVGEMAGKVLSAWSGRREHEERSCPGPVKRLLSSLLNRFPESTGQTGLAIPGRKEPV
jgi:flagellar biosynthesis protein FlhG